MRRKSKETEQVSLSNKKSEVAEGKVDSTFRLTVGVGNQKWLK